MKYWTCIGRTDHQRRPRTRASALPASGVVRNSAPPGSNRRRARSRASPGSTRCSITSDMAIARNDSGSSADSTAASNSPVITSAPRSRARSDAHLDGSTPIGSQPRFDAATRNEPVQQPTSSRRPGRTTPSTAASPRWAVATWPSSSRIDTGSSASAYAADIASGSGVASSEPWPQRSQRITRPAVWPKRSELGRNASALTPSSSPVEGTRHAGRPRPPPQAGQLQTVTSAPPGGTRA